MTKFVRIIGPPSNTYRSPVGNLYTCFKDNPFYVEDKSDIEWFKQQNKRFTEVTTPKKVVKEVAKPVEKVVKKTKKEKRKRGGR